MSELVRAIRTIAGTQLTDKLHLSDAEVVSVNTSTRTAEVRLIHGQSNQVLTARLMASVSDGCLYIPSDGSTVVIAYSDYVEPYVSQYSDVSRIIWLGGDYEGVPIVKDPSNTNKGLLKKINNIENLLNDLIDKYNLHTHPVSGSATTAPIPSFIESTKIAPITSQSDIQHPNITH